MPGPLTLQDFAKIAGTDVSTGYVSFDEQSGRLGKAAAHRHLTGSNAGELARLQNNPDGNRAVRLRLMQAVASSLKADQATRNEVMRFVADRLGFQTRLSGDHLQISFAENGPDGGQRTDAPLERRTVRNILRVVNSPELQTLLRTDGDTSIAGGTSEERAQLLQVLQNKIHGLDMKSLPLTSMSNHALRELGRRILERSVVTNIDARAFASEAAKKNLINTTDALLGYKAMLKTDQTVLKAQISLPSDRAVRPQREPVSLPQSDPKPSAPQAEAPKSGGLFGGLMSFMNAGRDVQITQTRLDGLMKGPDAGCQALVDKFRDDLFDALAPVKQDGVPELPSASIRRCLLGNLDAVTLILCQPEELLAKLSGGEGFRPFVDAVQGMIAENAPDAVRNLLSARNMGLIEGQIKSALSDPSSVMYQSDETLSGVRAAIIETLIDDIGREGFGIAAEASKSLAKVDAEAMRNFLADMILDQQTWIHDFSEKPGERLRATLMRHLDAVTVMLCEPERAKAMLSGPAAEMIDQAVGAIRAHFGEGDFEQYLSPTTAPIVRAKVEHMLTGMPGETLQTVEDTISNITKTSCAKVQQMASHAFEKMIAGESSGSMENVEQSVAEEEAKLARIDAFLAGLPPEQAEEFRVYRDMGVDPNEAFYEYFRAHDEELESLGLREADTFEIRRVLIKLASEEPVISTHVFLKGRPFPEAVRAFAQEQGLSMEPVPAQEAIGEKTLEELVGSGALDTKNGYGRFMVSVMKKYFAGVSEIDQRSMLASMIRFGSEKPPIEGETDQQRTERETANLALQLGALFKGAGPIMQKLLQQLGSSKVAPEFKLALEDMKCNLLPIPDDIVRLELKGVIDRSGGEITAIRVDKSLGAASVGQTFLCTITDKDGGERQAVIKILRPDAANRMEREKAIFLKAAEEIPGMKDTYLSRLERLQEELDLRIEAGNVKLGAAYDKTLKIGKEQLTDVHAMKLDPSIPTTKTVMVLERAPGKTVSDYMAENKVLLEKISGELKTEGTVSGQLDRLRQLDELRADVLEKQKQLLHLSYKWVDEGLFKDGFYHGDLHAGNIMIDTRKGAEKNSGLTVIDFGNATQLSSADQRRIMRMVYAARKENADLFLENYRKLMKPENHASFDAGLATAREYIAAIFAKGTENDVGRRVSAALMQMQKLGHELPGSVFNFSQCQMLIQGTVDQINEQIKTIDDLRGEIAVTLNTAASGTTAERMLESLKKDLEAGDSESVLGKYDLIAQDYRVQSHALRDAARIIQSYLTQIDEKPDETVLKYSKLPGELRAVLESFGGTESTVSKARLTEIMVDFSTAAARYDTFVHCWTKLADAEKAEPGAILGLIGARTETLAEQGRIGMLKTQCANVKADIADMRRKLARVPDGASLVPGPNIPRAAREAMSLGRPMSKAEALARLDELMQRTDLPAKVSRAVGTAYSNVRIEPDETVIRDVIILPKSVPFPEDRPFTKAGISEAVQNRLAALEGSSGNEAETERAELRGILTRISGYADDDYLGSVPNPGESLTELLKEKGLAKPTDRASFAALLDTISRETDETEASVAVLEKENEARRQKLDKSSLGDFAQAAADCAQSDVTFSRDYGVGSYPKFDKVPAPAPETFVDTMQTVIAANAFKAGRAVGVFQGIRALVS